MSVPDEFRLHGKTALVTGAKRGIGKAIALGFGLGLAEAGADIIGVSATLESAGSAIAPGYIDTDNTEALRNGPERNQAILSRIHACCWGNPDDFEGSAVYLASEVAAYVHGTVLRVNGGWMES